MVNTSGNGVSVLATSTNEMLTLSSDEFMVTPCVTVRHSASSPDQSHDSNNPPAVPTSTHIQTSPTHSVPSRLVPSQSTERILELLKQHDLEKNNKKESEPLSSTPAGKSGRPGVSSEQVQFSLGHRRESSESAVSMESLPEGTYLGEARHKDGSLLAIVFQVSIFRYTYLCFQ